MKSWKYFHNISTIWSSDPPDPPPWPLSKGKIFLCISGRIGPFYTLLKKCRKSTSLRTPPPLMQNFLHFFFFFYFLPLPNIVFFVWSQLKAVWYKECPQRCVWALPSAPHQEVSAVSWPSTLTWELSSVHSPAQLNSVGSCFIIYELLYWPLSSYLELCFMKSCLRMADRNVHTRQDRLSSSNQLISNNKKDLHCTYLP